MPEEILSNVDPSFSRSSNLGYNVYTLLLPRTRVQSNRIRGRWSLSTPKGYPVETDVPPQSRTEFPRIEVFHVHCCFFQSFGGLEPISLGNYNDREGILDTRPLGKQNFHREVLFGGSTLNKRVLFLERKFFQGRCFFSWLLKFAWGWWISTRSIWIKVSYVKSLRNSQDWDVLLIVSMSSTTCQGSLFWKSFQHTVGFD